MRESFFLGRRVIAFRHEILAVSPGFDGSRAGVARRGLSASEHVAEPLCHAFVVEDVRALGHVHHVFGEELIRADGTIFIEIKIANYSVNGFSTLIRHIGRSEASLELIIGIAAHVREQVLDVLFDSLLVKVNTHRV